MDEAGYAVEEAALQHVGLEEAEERFADERSDAIVLVAAPRHLVVTIGVVLAQDVSHAVVGKVLESQFHTVSGYAFNPAFNYRRGVDDGWPVSHRLAEEAQDVVGIATVHEASHEVVLAWDGNTVRTTGFLDAPVEVVAQVGRHNLVGIDDQHPLERSLFDGKLAGWFHDRNAVLGKGDDAATFLAGNL